MHQNQKIIKSYLLISFVKNHKRIRRGTLSRWAKIALDAAGINTMQFNPHSTRPVSTTAARGNSVSLQEILNTAAWSFVATFSRFMIHVSLSLEQQFATDAINVAVMK